jgi:hypothetical protein
LATKRQEYDLKRHLQSSIVTCACGCGTELHSISPAGAVVRYIKGHHLIKYHTTEEQQKAHLERRARHRRKNGKKLKIRHYRKRKIELMEIFGNKCSNCGLEYNGRNASLFEFHHTNPNEKDGMISKLLADSSFDKALTEARKCLMWCAPCHIIHHNGEW